MLWLVYQMWILIFLAFFGGVVAGWIMRARSDEAPERPMLETLDATVVAPVETPAPVVKTPSPEPVSAPESIEVAAPEPEPMPEPQPETPEPANAPADDLTKIKGLGPKAAAALNHEGVSRFDQVAAWKKADVERFDTLINGRGRIVRDEWVKQAKALAKT